jgi:P22_AR N-terminal domain
MADTTLVTVDFHGTTLHALTIDGKPYVSVRSICEALTVDPDAQLKRIKRHPVLSKGTVITTVPSGGGVQQAVCIPLDLLNGWLFGISANRVRNPELRDRLVQYQRDCFDVLARHFQKGDGRTMYDPLDRARMMLVIEDGQIKHTVHLGKWDVIVDPANRESLNHLLSLHLLDEMVPTVLELLHRRVCRKYEMTRKPTGPSSAP